MITLYLIAAGLAGFMVSASLPWQEDGMEIWAGVALLLLVADCAAGGFLGFNRGWAP
jgi:hypothetical protein